MRFSLGLMGASAAGCAQTRATTEPLETPNFARTDARDAKAPRSPEAGARRAPLGTVADADRAAAAEQARLDSAAAEPVPVETQIQALERAIGLYREFIARAEGDPAMAEAVARSRDRIKDASDALIFLRQTDTVGQVSEE
jgi:hypothetical protein